MATFTHCSYFRRYSLNVAQYGEILISQAFRGRMLGDTQRGYDVVTSSAAFAESLLSVGIGGGADLADLPDEIRIQVRSKLVETPSGKASVVHCKETDLLTMTHLAIVLVKPGARVSRGEASQEGLIHDAWLMTRDKAAVLRRKPGKAQYIGVSQLVDGVGANGDVLNIAPLLSTIANAEIYAMDD